LINLYKINTMATFLSISYQPDGCLCHFYKKITKIYLHNKNVSVTFTPCKRDNNSTAY
jgi:hypothetical protein